MSKKQSNKVILFLLQNLRERSTKKSKRKKNVARVLRNACCQRCSLNEEMMRKTRSACETGTNEHRQTTLLKKKLYIIGYLQCNVYHHKHTHTHTADSISRLLQQQKKNKLPD